MHLIVRVRDKWPNKIAEFRPAGRNHETHRAIDLAWCVPPLGKVPHIGADRDPYLFGRAEDHLARKDRIDFRSCNDGGAARDLMYGVAARGPFDSEQDCLFPRTLIEHVGLQFFARCRIADGL